MGPRGDNTLLKVESRGGAFSLNPETTYRVQIVDNKAKAEGSNGLPLFLGGAIDLSAGYKFTTTGNNYQYPRIVTMTPRATVGGTTMDVPTEIYLELGFSQTMDTVEVEKSTLRLTQYEPEPNQTTVKSFWDIHLATAQLITGGYSGDSGNIELSWHNTPRGDNTLLKVESRGGLFSLNPNTTYRVQIVDNQAKAADVVTSGSTVAGLPLIFGGPGAIDLLNGYKFKTASSSTLDYPEVLWVTPTPDATNVPTEIYLELGFSQP